MRRETAAAVLVWLVCATGCTFHLVGAVSDAPETDATDAPDPDAPDAALPVIVGFAGTATPADETSGAISIPITISAPATVTVMFAVTGGTAVRGADFTGPDGTLVFTGGDISETVPLTILADAISEGAETIVITLSSPTGASLGTSTHTVTISANALPRVNLSAATSTSAEATSPTITFMLNSAATTDVSVDYTIGGTATPTGTFRDFTLAAGTVTFPMGTVTQTRPLGVVPDSRHETDETAIITLTNPVGVIPGATSVQTHTISNDDTLPTVTITTGPQMPTENVTTVPLVVTLSAISGQTVTVPWTVSGTATIGAGNDYTLPSTANLVFPEGTTTQTIMVNILEDTATEANETVIVTLGTAVNAGPGPNLSRTITIVDDDAPPCIGTGAYAVCFPSPPSGPIALPSAIDTDTSMVCEASQPTNWTGSQGQPSSCFVYAAMITMTTNTTVTGSRPLVLVASGTINISMSLDVASHRGAGNGPGAPSSACLAFPTTPAGTDGGGGGAGASFTTQGGNGGQGASGGGGTSPAAVGAPAILRAGCSGQTGADGGGPVGTGGGAVYLVANGQLTIGGVINASGAGAAAGGNQSGGSGGGSGGMIFLQAASFNVTGGTLLANGGGGSSGGNNSNGGNPGSDPNPATPQTEALGGAGPGGDGGKSFPQAGSSLDGVTNTSNNNGGGGGGGAGGYIKANMPLTGAQVSAGLVQAP